MILDIYELVGVNGWGKSRRDETSGGFGTPAMRWVIVPTPAGDAKVNDLDVRATASYWGVDSSGQSWEVWNRLVDFANQQGHVFEPPPPPQTTGNRVRELLELAVEQGVTPTESLRQAAEDLAHKEEAAAKFTMSIPAPAQNVPSLAPSVSGAGRAGAGILAALLGLGAYFLSRKGGK